MTTYDGGTIRAAYELNLTPLEQNAQRALQILNDLQAKSAAIKAPTVTTAPTTTGPDPAKIAADTAKAQALAERSALALARAQASLAKETGDTSRAIEILSKALEGVDQNSVAAINTQRQLARATAEVEKGASRAAGSLQVLPRTIAGLSNEAAAAAQGLIGLFAIENVARFGVEAGRSAVQLERTQSVLKAVAGDANTYDKIVGIATRNQQLFGGSLNDNLATLQQFTFIANRTGASIEEINRVAQLLAAVKPAEGIEGAGFAISELAAGDVTSIVERFNLPREAINALKQEAGGDAAALLQGLTDILAQQGVTSEVLAASLTENAVAYTNLGVAAERVTNQVGGLLAELAREPTEGLTVVLNNISTLLSLSDRLSGTQAQILSESGGSFAAYQAAAAGVNAELSAIGQQLPILSQAQFLYNRALVEGGASEQQALAATLARGDSLSTIQSFTNQAAQEQSAYYDTFRDLPAVIAETIAADASYIGIITDLIAQQQSGAISADELRSAILRLAQDSQTTPAIFEFLADQIGRVRDGFAELNETDPAPVLDTTATAADAVDKALKGATQAAFETANAGGTLEAQAAAAARALLDEGAAGAEAAALLAGSVAEIDQLTLAYFRLQQQAGQGIAPPDLGAAFNAEVENAITRATGSTAEQLALVNEELAKSLPLSEERKKLLVERARLEQQASEESAREFEAEAKNRDRLAKAAARERETAANAAQRKAEAAVKAAEREQERIASIIERAQEAREKDIEATNQRIEDENKRHYDALARAQEDYELSASRDEEDFLEARTKLLAEGRRAEADALTRQFEKDRARAEEDEARRIARANEQNALKLADIDDDFLRRRAEAEQALAKEGLSLGGVQAPPTVAPPVAVAAPAVPVVVPETPVVAPVAGGIMPSSLRIEFAPISVLVDGQQVASAVYPPLEARLDAALAAGVLTVAVVAPPIGGQGQGVRGPRV